MEVKQRKNIQVIFFLVAILIATFVVFPGMMHSMDHNQEAGNMTRDWHKLNELGRDVPPPEASLIKPPFGLPSSPFAPPNAEPEYTGRVRFVGLEFIFYSILSWSLLWLYFNFIKAGGAYKDAVRVNWFSTLLLLLLVYLAFALFNLFNPPGPHKLRPFFWFLDAVLLFKALFVLVSVTLFGTIFKLQYQHHSMQHENEKLRAESLRNQLDALTAQISPHFFFNVLNSLSGLVREKQDRKALKYINEISHLFRYILQGKTQELVALRDEMQFLKTYCYLLEIRYEDRIQFDVQINQEQQLQYKLPSLSLQPLIENITKHNIISEELPVYVAIYISQGRLVVKNTYQPRELSEPNTGIGIQNLAKRYVYITGKSIDTYIHNSQFVVELPLITCEVPEEIKP